MTSQCVFVLWLFRYRVIRHHANSFQLDLFHFPYLQSSCSHTECFHLFPHFASPCQDEAGEEGVAVSNQEEGCKTIVVGKRFAVSKSREEQYEGKEDQQEAFSKLQDKMMKVDAVAKEILWGRVGFLPSFLFVVQLGSLGPSL